jgi:nitronate monooxygenase
MCIQYRVPIVITSLAARTDINDAVHSYGGLVLHDVTTDAFARKAIDKGADGLIAVAAGAGGHAGTVSPFALIQEIRQWFGGPLVLSGAITHGRSTVAAAALGADLAYIGSAFLATHEAHADASYKQMIVNSKSADIVYTDVFTGVHANYLRDSIHAAGLDSAALMQSEKSSMDFGSEADARPRPGVPTTQLPGATSGAPVRESARSTTWCPPPILSLASTASTETLRPN